MLVSLSILRKDRLSTDIAVLRRDLHVVFQLSALFYHAIILIVITNYTRKRRLFSRAKS